MKKVFFYVLATLIAALAAGGLSCCAQDIPAAPDSSATATSVAPSRSSGDWLKAKLDSLRLSTPQADFQPVIAGEEGSTRMLHSFSAPSDSAQTHKPAHDGYTEKLSTVRVLQDSVYYLRRKLESMQKRLDSALEEIQRIELQFLTGE